MRRATWASLAFCLVGGLAPMGFQLRGGWSLPLLVVAIASASPFAMAGLAAWRVRGHPVAARLVAWTTVAMFMVGAIGWWWGAKDGKSVNLALMVAVGSPVLEAIMLLAGFLVVWWKCRSG